MTTEQAAKAEDEDRRAYGANILKKNFDVPGGRRYADNTREPIRDETLRDGLVAIGAVVRRQDLPTTSRSPRYALKADFAALFDPDLAGDALRNKITAFHAKHLSKSALARVSIMLSGAAGLASGVMVMFPNGETRHLAPGPSSIISKAVVEVFARAFLEKPVVLWLSESGNKVVMRDDNLANSLGLKIDASKNLPDLILVDLGPAEPLIVFVEIVATGGEINRRRQDAIFELTDAAGFKRSQIAFVTAYQDREGAGFKKTVARLAWHSFAWFVSEPDGIVIWRHGTTGTARLNDLIT